MDSRKSWLDIFKGLGIILVIVGHLVNYDSLLTRYIFTFHMPMFFFASGYLFNKNKTNSTIRYLRHNVKRLIIPYWGFSLCGFVFTMILSAIGIITRPSMVTVIREVFYIGQPVSILSGHLWFLVCMFIVVITYYIITDLFKSNRQIIIILILCAIAGEIYSKFSPFQLPFKIGSAFSALVFYGAGNLFREFKGDFEIMFKFKILIVIVSTFASGFVLGVYINKSVNMADTQYNNVFLFYAAAFLGIILIFIISKLINKNRFLEFFGRNSLVIYGTHFYIAYCVVKTISVITRSTFMLFCLPYGVGLLASVCVIVLEIPVVFIANKLSELKNTKLNIIRRH